MKKALLIFAAVVLTPVLVVSLVLAAGDWRTIGQTEAGDTVSVSSVRVLKGNQRTALVRVEYKAPAELPQGGPFVEMRARVRFYCGNGTAAIHPRQTSGPLTPCLGECLLLSSYGRLAWNDRRGR